MAEDIKLKMTLPQIPDIELVAIEGLERMSRHLGISSDKIGDARILVTEAIINGLEHSGRKYPTVRVEFTMTREKLNIFVRDYGKGFEPANIDDPDIANKIGSKDKRGWGLKLMRSMSDDFIIESNQYGTKITIIKNLV